MSNKYSPTVHQFYNMLVGGLSNLENVTVTEVPCNVEGMHTFYFVETFHDIHFTRRVWHSIYSTLITE